MKGNSTIISASCKGFLKTIYVKIHLLINCVRGSIEKFPCLFIDDSIAMKIAGCPDIVINIQNFAKLFLLFVNN